MEHTVLDLTSLAYQPKSRERSARPTKPVTFTFSQRKSAYPARAQELDDDENDKLLVRPDHTTVPEDENEDDIPLVQPASKEEAPKRESSSIRRVPTPLRRKGLPFWRDPSATLEQDVSGNSREQSEDVSSLKKIQMVKLSRKLPTSCRMFATRRTFSCSITTCLLHNSRREQLTWIFQERFMTLPACDK